MRYILYLANRTRPGISLVANYSFQFNRDRTEIIFWVKHYQGIKRCNSQNYFETISFFKMLVLALLKENVKSCSSRVILLDFLEGS